MGFRNPVTTAESITGGVLDPDRIPDLDASKISGDLEVNQLRVGWGGIITPAGVSAQGVEALGVTAVVGLVAGASDVGDRSTHYNPDRLVAYVMTAGGLVPAGFTIEAASLTVPSPTAAKHAATKEYTDAGDTVTLAAAKTYAAPKAHTHPAGDVTGVLDPAQVPELDASKVVGGDLLVASVHGQNAGPLALNPAGGDVHVGSSASEFVGMVADQIEFISYSTGSYSTLLYSEGKVHVEAARLGIVLDSWDGPIRLDAYDHPVQVGGPLELEAAPTAPTHAVTKAYADELLPRTASVLVPPNDARFTLWTAGSDVTLIRSGNTVEMFGALRVVTAGVLTSDTINGVLTIPAGYRPTGTYARVRRGQSSQTSWVSWTVNPASSGSPGRVDVGRFGPAAASGANCWLPVAFSWTTADPWPA
jgi:hypothetical protein